MTEMFGERAITSEQLAKVRALIYAGRSVSTEDVRSLLEAYDGLRREMFAVRQSAEATYRTAASAVWG
jgi:hypothetical protein